MESSDLARTTWTLLQFETDAAVIPAVPEAPATLAFEAPGEPGQGAGEGTGEPVKRISGSGGCNRFVGTYSLTGDRLRLGPLGATRMMCTPSRMAQEERFFQALQAAERCELRGGQLLITHPRG